MGKFNALVHLFNIGEISKAGLARVDKEWMRLAAEQQENLIPYTIGKALMRPGTKFLGNIVSSSTIGTNPPRLIPFVKSLSTKALLELSSVYGLRVWINDAIVTYPAVTSVIGAFTTSVLTGDATATLGTANGDFEAVCPNQGGTAIVKKQVTTSSANIEHAISIVITRGAVDFRIGSTDGGYDYLGPYTLGVGTHILSFTPTGSYWVRFLINSNTTVIVASCYIYNTAASPGLGAEDLKITGPWSTDLRSIRYDQSLDTVFLVVPDSAPYKIERRSNRSWSIVPFLPTNGPFMLGRSDAKVRLKPGATHGSTTLASDLPFFQSYHDGTLFRLTHDNYNATFGLAAEGVYTKAFRQSGVTYTTGADDRVFTVTVAGTWVGTINIQRSYNNEIYGFKNHGADITSNVARIVTGSSEDDNAIVWYRVIFTSYTSGSAQITINYPGYGESGICRVISVSNTTSAFVDVLKDFTDTAYTESWLESEWSSERGFPTAVALFDGRLWWARKDRFWGSESDNYYSYDVTVTGDAASIQRDVATGGAFSEIQWMLPLQRLIFGTAGAEVSARASGLDEPLTGTAITVKDGSSQGCANVTPVKVDGKGIFVQRSGRKLMELAYSIKYNDYTATDLMRYNETIGTALEGVRITNLVDYDIVELAIQRHPDTYIWCVRDDGVVPVLLYNPDQDIMGWFKFISGQSYASGSYLASDKIVSVAVLPGGIEDAVYFVTQRRYLEDYGNTVQYTYDLDKLEQHQSSVYKVISDATTSTVSTYNGLYQADSYETATVSADGLTIYVSIRLVSCTVIVIGPHYDSSGNVTHYGPIGDTYTVNTNDTVTLAWVTLASADANLAGDTVTVGLPYTGKYKSAKLAYGAREGTSLLQKKRIAQTGVLISDYHPSGVQIGSDFDDANAMDDLPLIEKGVPVELNSTLPATLDGDMFAFPGVWDTDARVCLKVKPGYSATFNAIVVSVETHER